MDTELKYIKAFISEDEKSIDEINHKIIFTIPEVTDREDDIVTADAIFNALHDSDNFAVNPICQPCHQSKLDDGKPPCVGSWDVASSKKVSKGVNLWLNFAVGPNPDQEMVTLGDYYWWCYSKRHMRAVSIGFRAVDWEIKTIKGKQVRIINKIILYEISCVPVGCNQGALSKLKSMFGLDSDFEKSEKTEIPQSLQKYLDNKFEEMKTAFTEQFEELKLLAFPDSDKAAKCLLGLEENIDSPGSAEKDLGSEQIDDEQLEKAFKQLN